MTFYKLLESPRAMTSLNNSNSLSKPTYLNALSTDVTIYRTTGLGYFHMIIELVHEMTNPLPSDIATTYTPLWVYRYV